MMKLTVAILASLAVADAANFHGHAAKRQYGYGTGYNGGYSVYTPVPVPTSEPMSPSAKSSSASVPAKPCGGYGQEHCPTLPGSASVPTYPGTGLPSMPLSSALPAESSSAPVYATTGAPAYPTTGYSLSVTDSAANSTIEYITSVIVSTQIFTVTRCPPEVTDCPAESTALVTSVVPITTTVCPKPTGVPEGSASSGYPVSSYKPVVTKTSVSLITHVTTATLVYTIGVGSTARPVTTEVTKTRTETIYRTIVVTVPGHYTPSSVPTSNAYPVETPTSTTTIKSTSTTTKYITVHATPQQSGYPVTPEGGKAPTDSASGAIPTYPAGESECAAPVTVTVTAQETVTVTVGQKAPSSVAAGEKSSTPVYPTLIYSTPVYSTPSAATSSAPYPVGNGTLPYPTGGPTGFITATYVPVFSLPASESSTEIGTSSTASPYKPKETVVSVIYVTPSPVAYPTGGHSNRKRFGRI